MLYSPSNLFINVDRIKSLVVVKTTHPRCPLYRHNLLSPLFPLQEQSLFLYTTNLCPFLHDTHLSSPYFFQHLPTILILG
jgi:hypothetical protein